MRPLLRSARHATIEYGDPFCSRVLSYSFLQAARKAGVRSRIPDVDEQLASHRCELANERRRVSFELEGT
jgi:hypothetical protein